VKIAFLTELFYPNPAGTERRFLELGKRLVQRGHEIHVYTLQYDSSLPKQELVEGIIVHRYAATENYLTPRNYRSLGGVFKYSFETFKRLIGQDFDIYYSNQWPIFHSLFAKPVASPLIQEWCEVWQSSWKVVLLQRLLKMIGDHNVAVSEFTRQRMLNFVGLDPEKIALIPNGVDYKRFHRSQRKKWGRIIYVGRLVPHKHVEWLLAAFHQMKPIYQEAELHIVGQGPLLSSLKNQASVMDDCFIHGYLSDNQLIELLNSSWLFVLPSEREGSSIAVLEAMAAGLPFVTLNHPNNAAKELIKHKCGLIADPSSYSISKTIRFLLENDEEYFRMRDTALSYTKRRDWESVTNCMEKYFYQIKGHLS
jgi:glycosyltransferase involved in cell wall biosynthesis